MFHIVVSGPAQTSNIFRPNLIMEGKSSTRKTELQSFSHFRRLIMSNLTVVSGSEFECFISVERDWNTKIFQKVPGFLFSFFEKKDGFFPKLLWFCQCRCLCHRMDSSQTCQNYSTENFKKCQTHVENLHCQRILTVGSLSVYLFNQIQFRLILYFELSD